MNNREKIIIGLILLVSAPLLFAVYILMIGTVWLFRKYEVQIKGIMFLCRSNFIAMRVYVAGCYACVAINGRPLLPRREV